MRLDRMVLVARFVSIFNARKSVFEHISVDPDKRPTCDAILDQLSHLENDYQVKRAEWERKYAAQEKK